MRHEALPHRVMTVRTDLLASEKRVGEETSLRRVEMTVLVIALAAIAAIWVCVLLMAPMLGSNH